MPLLPAAARNCGAPEGLNGFIRVEHEREATSMSALLLYPVSPAGDIQDGDQVWPRERFAAHSLRP